MHPQNNGQRKKKTRDGSIDVLRSIGLLCIVLAHVVPPNWLFQIRNFDVPLMVFISGYLYAGRANQIQSFTSLLDYLGKRFVRLVVPVWIFLSLFYLIQYCFPSVFPINYTLFPDVMRSSYLLLEGFGYVWIIRVFLMMAILGPLSMVYFKKPISILYYYISYEVVYLLVQPYLGDGIGKQFNEILLYTAGFLVFFPTRKYVYIPYKERQNNIIHCHHSAHCTGRVVLLPVRKRSFQYRII